jgi:hypothetical protein
LRCNNSSVGLCRIDGGIRGPDMSIGSRKTSVRIRRAGARVRGGDSGIRGVFFGRV